MYNSKQRAGSLSEMSSESLAHFVRFNWCKSEIILPDNESGRRVEISFTLNDPPVFYCFVNNEFRLKFLLFEQALLWWKGESYRRHKAEELYKKINKI